MKDKYEKGDFVATEHGKIKVETIFNKFKDENNREGYYCIYENNKQPTWLAEYKDWLMPLLTEGQIRRFIEDKTSSFISTKYNFNGYTVYITDELTIESDDINFKREFNTIETNLLLAYWYVACQIAEEG